MNEIDPYRSANVEHGYCKRECRAASCFLVSHYRRHPAMGNYLLHKSSNFNTAREVVPPLIHSKQDVFGFSVTVASGLHFEIDAIFFVLSQRNQTFHTSDRSRCRQFTYDVVVVFFAGSV